MSLLLDALRRAEQDSKKRKLADAETPAGAPDLTLAEAVAAQELAAAPELTLQAQSPVSDLAPDPQPEAAPREAEAAKNQSGFGAAEAGTDASFLDFELPSDDVQLPEVVVPASLAPRKASHPYGRYDRPAWEDSSSNWGALVANPVLSKRPVADDAPASGPAPIKPAAPKMAEPLPERPVFARPIDSVSLKPASRQPATPAASPPLAATPRQALSAAGVMAGRKKISMRDSGDGAARPCWPPWRCLLPCP